MTQPEPEKKSWVDKVAQRTTGLGDARGPKVPETAEDAAERRKLWRFAGVGIEFAATVAIFSYGGYWLDQHFGWGSKATITGTIIAVVGGLYLLIKQVIKFNE